MWNTVLNINSTICALAVVYLVYAAGASIFYLTLRPLEFGILVVLLLLCTEVLFSILENEFDE